MRFLDSMIIFFRVIDMNFLKGSIHAMYLNKYMNTLCASAQREILTFARLVVAISTNMIIQKQVHHMS